MKKRTSSKTLLKPTKYQHFHLSGRSRGPPQTTKITPGAPLDPRKIEYSKTKCRYIPKLPKSHSKTQHSKTAYVTFQNCIRYIPKLHMLHSKTAYAAFQNRHVYGSFSFPLVPSLEPYMDLP